MPGRVLCGREKWRNARRPRANIFTISHFRLYLVRVGTQRLALDRRRTPIFDELCLCMAPRALKHEAMIKVANGTVDPLIRQSCLVGYFDEPAWRWGATGGR